MGGRDKRLLVKEERLADRDVKGLPSADSAAAAPPLTIAPRNERAAGKGIAELITSEYPNLLQIAQARIRLTSTNLVTDIKDVTQNGILKFLRARSKRDSDYQDPDKVLRSAVWQEGVRHTQTSGRERPVDFNELHAGRGTSDDSDSNGYRTSELLHKTIYNPIEMTCEFLDIKQKFEGLTKEDKELFEMSFLNEMKPREIASVRGCSVMTVYRAVGRLKKYLCGPSTKARRTRLR